MEHKVEFDGRLLYVTTDDAYHAKAQEMLTKYPTSFKHCVRMMNKYSAKVKDYLERQHVNGLNEAEVQLCNDAEASFMRWEKMLDEALEGNMSQLFINMNNLKLKE